MTDASPVRRLNGYFSIGDSVNLIRGKHTIQAGVEVRRNKIDTNTDQNARGTFTFSGLLTSALDERGQPVRGTGFDFADFLLGFPAVELDSLRDYRHFVPNWPHLCVSAG